MIMFSTIFEDFKKKFESKIHSQTEKQNTKMFWDEMKKMNNFKLIRTQMIYPNMDWWDIIDTLKEDWWNILSLIWDWPFSIYLYRSDELVHYLEGELSYYKFK